MAAAPAPVTAQRLPLRAVDAGPSYGEPGHWAYHLEFCTEHTEPRLIGGQRKRVVVSIRFTVQGTKTDEQNILGFRARMESFAHKLETLNGCSVEELTVRRHKGRLPVAEFDVRLPEFKLPKPII